MDRVTMRARCKERFRDTANAIYSDDEWNSYLGEAARDVYTASPWWPFLDNLALLSSVGAGTEYLSFDGGVIPEGVRVRALYNVTDALVMQPIRLEDELDTLEWAAGASNYTRGTPLYYRVDGAGIMYPVVRIFPIPDRSTVFRVHFRRDVIDDDVLSGEASVPLFPAKYHPMLIEGAMARAYEDDGNNSQADRHWARFNELLGNMKHELLTGLDESYPELVDNFWR